MPFAKNNGVNIHYEVQGAGEPLVLLHGFTSSKLQWDLTGHIAELQKSHQLILIDQRGHGKSDKPHAHADYTLDKRMDDVRAVLNELDIGSAHFYGFSMGGWIAFGMAANFPELVRSLIIGGAHPYADSLQSFHGIDGSDNEVFMHAFEQFIGEKIAREVRVMVLQNDLAALSAAAVDRNGFAAQLATMQQPLLLLVGDLDKRLNLVQQTAQALPKSKLVVLPGVNHAALLFSSAVLLPHIKAFLSEQHH